MATREEVLAAYAANPKAELTPSQAAIDYWMGSGLGQFNTMVDAVRAANPTLASQIDADRGAKTRTTTTGTVRPPDTSATDVLGDIGFTSNTTTGATTAATTGATTSPNLQMVLDAYKTLGRTGVGTGTNQIDQGGLNYWLGEIDSGRLKPADFGKTFYKTVGDYYTQKPTDAITQYTAPILQDNAYRDILTQAYGGIGRTGFGTDVKQIDQGGFDFWLNAMKSGQYNTNGQFDPNKFLTNFNSAVSKYITEFPTSDLTTYVKPYTSLTPSNITSNLLVNAITPTSVTTPTTPAIPAAQFRELFPAFSESKRLAGEMVANRPSMESIIAMLQGQGQQTPVTTPVAGQGIPSLSNVLNTISR